VLHRQSESRIGLVCAILAFSLWGFFPLYWNLLDQFPSLALACHRVLWAFAWLAVLVPVLMLRGGEVPPRQFLRVIAAPRVWSLYAFAAAMLAINWLAFLWAVNNNEVLQASLGYYINPLLSVLLGVFVLGERLEVSQWLAVCVAALGVTVMTLAGDGLPWASLAMASAFAMYGLAKKKTPLPSLSGLWVEVTVLLIPAALTAWLLAGTAEHRAVEFTPLVWALLIGGGGLTILPLTLFAAGARRLPLSTVGVLQYIGPTLQFLVGTLINGEEFDWQKLVGFVCVWCGSIIYLAGSRRRMPRRPPASNPAPTTAVDVPGRSH
jgi:chloramphenicol-sensitive protein RarD